MDVFFLSAAEALTKTFTLASDGSIEKTQYPPIKKFTSHKEVIDDIGEFYKQIQSHAAKGECIIKGRVHRTLKDESRAGSTLPDDESDWLCLDADRIEGIIDSEDLMNKLGMGDVSYVEQLSASSGINKNDTSLSAHIFVRLDKLYSAIVLKNFLTYLNFTNPILLTQLRLTKSEVALTYSLDITVAQSDKLLFIAPPRCVGFADPLPKRIQLVKKSTDVFSIPEGLPSSDSLEKIRRGKINELRIGNGQVSRRVWKTKEENGVIVLAGATACGVTGVKTERGRTYLNINGGDSWAYWHPLNDPRTIYSFKGDGPLSGKEFVPEYFKSMAKALANVVHEDGKMYRVYRDFRTAQYYNYIYDPATHTLEHYKAASLTQLQHFMEQHDSTYDGVPEDWRQVYEPKPLEGFHRLNTDNREINLYTPPEASKHYDASKTWVIPPNIYKVLLHAFGDHVEFTNVVINGWAHQVQTGEPPFYAVIAHGVVGTGKGIIMNDILPVVFGKTNVKILVGTILNEPYNSYMENTQVVCYNEVDSKMLRNGAAADAFLKHCITEPEIPIRAMYKEAYTVPRKCSIFMASNKPTPVHVERGDRRMNLGEFQENPLVITEAEVDEIRHDSYVFRNYLMQFVVDPKLLRYIVPTKAREEVMLTTAVGASEFVRNFITDGSMRFILEQLPMKIPMDALPVHGDKVTIKEYAYTAYKLIQEMQGPECVINVTREELQTLLRYNFSNVPSEPYKFTSYIKHYRVHLKCIRKSGMVTRGIQINIKMNDDDWVYCQEMFTTTLIDFANLDK